MEKNEWDFYFQSPTDALLSGRNSMSSMQMCYSEFSSLHPIKITLTPLDLKDIWVKSGSEKVI